MIKKNHHIVDSFSGLLVAVLFLLLMISFSEKSDVRKINLAQDELAQDLFSDNHPAIAYFPESNTKLSKDAFLLTDKIYLKKITVNFLIDLENQKTKLALSCFRNIHFAIDILSKD